MLIHLLAQYTIVIFLVILGYLLFKEKNLFLKAIASCIFTWILNRILEGINLYFLKFFSKTFPSDHTAIGCAIGAIIFFKRKIFGSILILLAILMGYMRVLAGFHEFIDILGGAITGFGCTFLMNTCLTVGRE